MSEKISKVSDIVNRRKRPCSLTLCPFWRPANVTLATMGVCAAEEYRLGCPENRVARHGIMLTAETREAE